MKNRLNLTCALFFLLTMGLNAAPVNFKTAKETARKFYGVQMSVASVKSMPDFSCVFPQSEKSGEAVPYYIFNVGEDQGFVIVAGDDNATRSVLAYSDKGRFEVENMPENVKAWLGFYAESIKRAAKSELKGNFSLDFSKAEVVKEPLLGNISYNQDAPYNELCPIDRRTGRRSVTGCVATALATIARYYQYPKTGKGSITYNSNGQELTMDFSQNTYDWDNMLEEYNGPVSTYTQEQITAVATLMRDCGYAVRMAYGSDASGAIRDNTVIGVVDYLGFDSVLSYRERDYYDNDDQWKALLRSNLDNDLPVYYSGQSEGGGHAFVCDGYDDSDLFHFDWGWGGSWNGYFAVEYMNPDGGGIGAGSGGYTDYQGILHNMVPPGHKRVSDTYLLMVSGQIEPEQVEDSIYPIHENPITVPFRSFQNYSMSRFDGVIALGLFKDGEFVEILSDEERVAIARRSAINVSFTLAASLDGVEAGEYEIWAVGKSDADSAEWEKIYAVKANKYTNDSYIPVSVGSDTYKLLKTTAVVSIQMDCQLSRNINMYVYSNGFELGSGQVSPSTARNFSFRYGLYELRFWTRGYDTTYINLNVTKDTALLVPLQERLLPPYIRGVRAGVGVATLLWRKEAPNGETAYPNGYIVYLDSVEVARVGTSTVEYQYTELPVGVYQAGLKSSYLTGESPMAVYTFRISSSDVANEKEWKGVCRLNPNPSSNGNFVVEVEQNCRLQVCDLMGKVLIEQKLASGFNQVDMTGYPAGIYVFRLTAGNGQAASLKAVLRK